MKTFKTAALMAQASLKTPQYVETYGEVSVGDDGAARYFIEPNTYTPEPNDVTLANGNIARRVSLFNGDAGVSAQEVLDIVENTEVNHHQKVTFDKDIEVVGIKVVENLFRPYKRLLTQVPTTLSSGDILFIENTVISQGWVNKGSSDLVLGAMGEASAGFSTGNSKNTFFVQLPSDTKPYFYQVGAGEDPNGYLNYRGINGVWKSEDMLNWTAVTLTAPWEPTRSFHASHMLWASGKFWVIENWSQTHFKVWDSSDGINWNNNDSFEIGSGLEFSDLTTCYVFGVDTIFERLYVSFNSGGTNKTFWTEDGGTNWSTSVAFSITPTQAGSHAYGGNMSSIAAPYTLAIAGNSIYRNSDNNSSDFLIEVPLPDPMESPKQLLSGKNGKVFCLTESGKTYYSLDSGTNWILDTKVNPYIVKNNSAYAIDDNDNIYIMGGYTLPWSGDTTGTRDNVVYASNGDLEASLTPINPSNGDSFTIKDSGGLLDQAPFILLYDGTNTIKGLAQNLVLNVAEESRSFVFVNGDWKEYS